MRAGSRVCLGLALLSMLVIASAYFLSRPINKAKVQIELGRVRGGTSDEAVVASERMGQKVDPDEASPSPVSAGADSKRKGGHLFSQRCAECHLDGEHYRYLPRTSRGGLILSSDYTFRSRSSSQSLYRTIKQGVRGTAMAPFKRTLTNPEIWHVVNFIQSARESGKQ